MGFWLAFSGVNCELLGAWLFISPFLGFWWDFDGVEWKSIGFSLQPSLVALTHFWDFGGILMGLNGNQLVLVTTMFGGTDPFLGFRWGFDGVEWKSIGFSLQPSLVALTHFWDFGGILMGF